MNNAEMKAKAIAQALAAFDAGFTSKSAQKEAMSRLNRAYECIREDLHLAHIEAGRATFNCDTQASKYWDYLEARELPHNLHQFRAAKHELGAGDALVEIVELQELREEMKAAEINVKPESAAAVLRREEKAATKAIDDGFRPSKHVSAHLVHCYLSEHGTHYLRGIWYLDYSRVAFATVAHSVGIDRGVWEAAGKPDMTEMSRDEIKSFYSVAA